LFIVDRIVDTSRKRGAAASGGDEPFHYRMGKCMFRRVCKALLLG